VRPDAKLQKARSRSFRGCWRACDGQSFNQRHSRSDFQRTSSWHHPRRRDVDALRSSVLAGDSEPCCIRIDSFPRFDKTARAAQLWRGLQSISPVLLHAPKRSKPPGPTSAKSMLFVVFLSAHGQESKVRDRSEVAYNPHPRRRSSVVEQPPCKRQVVCSIQTGGTSFTRLTPHERRGSAVFYPPPCHATKIKYPVGRAAPPDRKIVLNAVACTDRAATLRARPRAARAQRLPS
jgi:hypothetical protein